MSARSIWFAIVFTTLGVASGAAAPRETFAGTDDRWVRFESPRFELFSHVGDADSRTILWWLELIRALFLDSNHLVERQPVPVSVYAFSSVREFNAYKPERMSNVTGLYFNEPDRAVILLGPSTQRDESRRIVHHEYIHHLVRVTGLNPPLWLDEGIAELFSTLEVRGSKVVFGQPIPGHVYALQNTRLLPPAALFSATSTDVHTGSSTHSGRFYAQSWALLHQWYFGRSSEPTDKVSGMVNRILTSKPSPDAQQIEAWYREATGRTFVDLQEDLESYVRRGRYGMRSLELPALVAKETYSVRRIDRAETRERLAELALRLRRDPAGKFAMLEATQTGDAARAWEVLGADAVAEGDEALARERWQAAASAGSRNPAVHHELAVRESRRWFAEFDYYFRLPEERAVELRGLLLRSIEHAPHQSEAFELLAWVESAAPQPSVANVNLVQAKFATLDDRPKTLLALALVRLRLGDRDTGLGLLDALEKSNPRPEILRAARQVRDIVVGHSTVAVEEGAQSRPWRIELAPGVRKPE